MAKRLALSITQLNEYVRRLFQQDPLLREIELRGEISNLKWHQTGTLFFTLKDEAAAVSCVMYAEDALSLQVEPFDGMRVVASGSVGLYTRGGQYQFYVKSLRAQGLGVLFERFQALKEKLAHEGLFDEARKQCIPDDIETVGVVSSPTGAVIHDILSVSLRRDEQARILLCPVRVQGPEAADEVVRALHMLDQLDHVSVIILARGGGSMEDLWTFNEERVVRAVAACQKPVVSAIGHETDVTLCDFAADLRAPTPSAAAECVTPLRKERMDELARLKEQLMRAALSALYKREALLNVYRARLGSMHPMNHLKNSESRITALKKQLRHVVDERLFAEEKTIEEKRRALALLSPYHVLSRGYALVTHNGTLLSGVTQANTGDSIEIRLYDGQLTAMINEVEYRPPVQKEGE